MLCGYKYTQKKSHILGRTFFSTSIFFFLFSDQNINLKVRKILHEFDLVLDNNAIIVTDRGSNMVAAFQTNNHMFCINHLMHNTLQKSMENIPDVANLIHSCTKLVKYFKVTGLNSNLNTTLKSFSPTRWNTIYYELVSIEANWAEIVQILQQKNEMNRVSTINLNVITALIKILEEFEKTSKKLEGENYPTIHLVYIYIYRLKTICSPATTDIQVIKEVKEKLTMYLDSIVFKNLTIYHKITLFLFPPFNTLIKFSAGEKQAVKEECICIMKSYQEQQDEQQIDQLEEVTGISNENNVLFCEFMPNLELPSPIDKISNEISTYETIKTPFYDDFKILPWWDVHKNQLPLLFKVSCKILATPASSAASERTFSAGRNLISEKRSSIASNDNTINQIMFLHSNLGEHELQTRLNEKDNEDI